MNGMRSYLACGRILLFAMLAVLIVVVASMAACVRVCGGDSMRNSYAEQATVDTCLVVLC